MVYLSGRAPPNDAGSPPLMVGEAGCLVHGARPLRRATRRRRRAGRGRGSGPGLLVPAQDTQRPQGVPPARPAVAVLKLEVDRAGMRVLQQPGAVGLSPGAEHRDRSLQPLVRHTADCTEVVEGAQNVVLPADRKRALQPGWIHDLAGALPTEEPAFEEVLLAPASGRAARRRAAGSALVRQQAFQDVNRRRERRADRPVLRLAVPAAVLKLLTEEPGNHGVHRLAEV